MKAVLRLVLTFFTGTPILKATTAAGLVCGAGSWIGVLFLPPLGAQHGLPSRFNLWQEALINLVPVLGILCFAFGASLLPAVVTRLAVSHYLYVLPHGRAKLLASVVLTLAAIALFASAATMVFYVKVPSVPLSFVFSRAFPVALLTYSFVYVVLWFTARSRAVGVVAGTVVIIAALVVPLRYIAAPSTNTAGVWLAGGVLWAAAAAAFLLAPRLKRIAGRVRQAIATRVASASYRGGNEVDYVVGTARPWGLALGQLLPVAIGAWLIPGLAPGGAAAPYPQPWLMFMTILSVLAAAMTSVAATRSRALWLRAHWTRAQLFSRIEAAFWRQNCCSIGVLAIAIVAIGYWFALPSRALAFGLALMLLGPSLSTYLGLMITSTINWLQALLAVAAVGGLLAFAAYAADPAAPLALLAACVMGLAAAAIAFREIARRRWRNLDWMLCRPDGAVRAST
jgi:hypothetical protein